MPETAEHTPATPDESLSAAVDVARAALLEITPTESIGEFIGTVVEDENALSVQFECSLAGYPGWHWSATVARVNEQSAPTVLEIGLLPGEAAVVAPDWVPWSDRAADDGDEGDEGPDDGDDIDDDDSDDDSDDALVDDDLDETDLVDDELDDAIDHLDEDDIIAD